MPRLRLLLWWWLAGCSCLPLRAVDLDIPLFAGGYGTAFYEESAREFEKLRPDVRIKIYGDPRISDKLRVRIIDGNLPDAMLPFDVLIPALVSSGKLRELSPFLDQPNWEGDARWGDTFVPGAFDAWRIGGGVYGLPLSYACWTIFYNRALFRTHGWEVPKTWDEFFALCEKIKATGIAPVSLTGIFSNYPDAIVRSAFYNLAGVEGWRALNDTAPGLRSDPRYVRAAGVLQRITQNYTLRGWDGATHTAAQLGFIEGRAAMCVSGSWMIYEMGDKIPADFDIGVMNFPVFPDGVADPTTIQAGADNLFVFATGDPERERATIDFLRFLTSRSRIQAFVRRTDSPAAVRGVPIEAFSPRMRETAAMIAGARESFNMPQRMLQPPAIRQVLIDARLELMAGRITPEEFGRRVEAAAEIDRRRAAEPERVDYRYPIAGTLLLFALAAIGWWAARARGAIWGRNPPEAAAAERAATFGRLRAPVALGFVGPALLLYAGLVVLPGIAAFTWAFTRWDGMGERAWSGLFNFKWLLFESDLFWAALKNNAFLMLVPALTVLPLALSLAYALHRGALGGRFFRAVFLFPNLLGGIAATLLWMSAYAPHGGLANAALSGLGNLLHVDALRGFAGYPWLAPRNLYWSLVPIYLWMACGFNLVLFLAAMEGIDPQLYEAAELDGASKARQFFTLTLPLIWDVVVIAVVFIVIAGLNAFEMIWLLTQQDPDTSTHTLGTLMVTSMFKDFQVGRATAIAVMLFILVLAGSAAAMRGLKREAIE
jgi:ABC-type sugar transport system permease subunit/ABC-type glycerol-3-phosphate transport system substrate-binding protein